MRSYIEKSYKHGLDMLMVNRRWKQVPLTSCFFDGCIERGSDLVERTKYNILSCGSGFFANMVDMLAAIREVIYEKKEATLKDIADACAANFEGYQSLHKKLKDAPKHGNDDERLVDIIKLIEDTQTEYVKEICRHPVDGTPYGITHITRSDAVIYGKVTPATPDGRLGWTPLASSVAASVGAERNGPTAVLKSMMSMNPQKGWQCGYNANIRFTREMLAREENRQKVRQMLNVFFDNNGQELQINCVDTAVLREAQKNPEQYIDLVVRVAGYCEFFTKLRPEAQEDIINRTEHRV
jgi:formate C-acetyltransferase